LKTELTRHQVQSFATKDKNEEMERSLK